MRKNSFWLKLAAVLIIQALFLTQVDFSLAAINHSKEIFQEAALKYQKMTDKHTSLIVGIGCVQLSLSGLLMPKFSLSAVLGLLKGAGSSISECITQGEVSLVFNAIYKDFTCSLQNFEHTIYEHGFYVYQEDLRIKIAEKLTKESTGPPMGMTTVEQSFHKPNC